MPGFFILRGRELLFSLVVNNFECRTDGRHHSVCNICRPKRAHWPEPQLAQHIIYDSSRTNLNTEASISIIKKLPAACEEELLIFICNSGARRESPADDCKKQPKYFNRHSQDIVIEIGMEIKIRKKKSRLKARVNLVISSDANSRKV